MDSQTIMPDGRPLFAWENELEMMRAQQVRQDKLQKELGVKWTLLNIVEIEQKRDYHTGDYLFRIRRDEHIQNSNPVAVLESAEITRL